MALTKEEKLKRTARNIIGKTHWELWSNEADYRIETRFGLTKIKIKCKIILDDLLKRARKYGKIDYISCSNENDKVEISIILK